MMTPQWPTLVIRRCLRFSRALRGDPADDSVGSTNIPGYNRVVALADYLVTLKVSHFDDCNNFYYYYNYYNILGCSFIAIISATIYSTVLLIVLC